MVDVAVVGGGHNGLTAAAYLARAGRSVVVLERRAQFGGAAVSERPWPGVDARLSRYSYLVSLMPRQVIDELGLDLRLADRPVAAYADGLLVETDARSPRTRASFPSPAEHDRFLAWSDLLDDAMARLWPTFVQPLPTREEARALLGEEVWQALVERPLGATLEERFEDPLVRGMVATDGLIGTFASLHDPSLVQNVCFLYHLVGGRWRVPVGGMGRVSAELERAARAAGAELIAGAEVLHHAGGEVTWRDADGAEHALTARHVLLNASPSIEAEGAQLKVNLLLDRLPQLKDGTPPELAFAGTFRLNERFEQLERAYAQAARGELPDEPPAELYCHTLTDRSILGDGDGERHTLTIFGLHAPARIFREPHHKHELVDRYLDALQLRCSDDVRALLAREANGEPCIEAKTPQELERELGLPGGHIFHGDLSWPWQEPEHEDGPWGVDTEDPRVLLCGARARRSGGVSGLGGRDAAMRLLDL